MITIHPNGVVQTSQLLKAFKVLSNSIKDKSEQEIVFFYKALRPIYSFLKISSQKGHYVHGKSTTVMVESDAKALRHYGLTRALYVDHNPNKLTTVVVS